MTPTRPSEPAVNEAAERMRRRMGRYVAEDRPAGDGKYDMMMADLDAALATERRRAITDLEKYGRHLYDCEKSRPAENPWLDVRCTCGEGAGSIHQTWCARSVAFRELEPQTTASHLARQCTCGLDAALQSKKVAS